MADLAVDGGLEEAVSRYYGGKYRRSAVMKEAYEAEDFFPEFGEGGKWLFFTAAPLKDAEGNIVGAIETLQDITESRRAGEALQASQERLSQIVRGVSVPAFVINEEHVVTHWNEACENLTGLSADEVVGTRRQWSAFYAAERPVMADLAVDGALEEAVARYYGGKYRRSAVMKEAYEAEDFFPEFGEGGK